MVKTMKQNKLFTVALWLLSGLPAWAGEPGMSKVMAACSAFSEQGNAATAILTTGELNLKVTMPSGQLISFVLPIKGGEDDCKIFFNASGDLAAVALGQRELTSTGLHVAVAHVSDGQWTSEFTVQPQDGGGPTLSSRVPRKDLVSRRERRWHTSTDGPPRTMVASLIVDAHGKIRGSPIMRTVPGKPTNQGSKYTDTRNDRLWFQSYPEFCPLHSVTLTGQTNAGPVIEKQASQGACDLPDAIAYPDADSVVMAATRSDKDWVWRVDLKSQSVEKLALPQARTPSGQQVRDIDHLSPDGQVFAIQRKRFSYGLFDNFKYQGDEIAVVQVHPLKLLGVIRPKHEHRSRSFAVDHRDGKVTLHQGYWDDQWQREQLNP